MAKPTLRLDLKTAGGEVYDILLRKRFVGTLVLVYREGQRLSGSVQLDKDALSPSEKGAVVQFVRGYVQQFIDAVEAQECDVMVTYSKYDQIIATEQNVGEITEFVTDEEMDDNLFDDEDYQIRYDRDDDTRVDGMDEDDRDVLELEQAGKAKLYELVIVGESRNRVEYHVYDRNRQWIAEAFLRIRGTDVFGDVNFSQAPSEGQIEHVADLIVSDFDENEIDSFLLDMKYEGEIMETIELTHEDLIDEEREIELQEAADFNGNTDYTVVMTRDDGDTLTYDVYNQTRGGLPVGSATVDISRRRLTGYIDLLEPQCMEDRDEIATMLVQEVEKEKDYESFNITMMYQNRPIDEILFESEQVH